MARALPRRMSAPRVWLPRLALALALMQSACSGGTSIPAASTAVSGSATPVAAAFPRAVTDASGTEVKLAAPARRIVSLSAGLTEVIFAIGVGDRLVATDRFSDYPEAAKSMPKLEYSAPSAEATLAFTPDLVIMTRRQKPEVAQFRSLGLPVLYLDEAASVQGVLDQIVMLGTLTGQDAQAQALVASMQQRIDAVTTKLSGVQQGPRVFLELSPELHSVGTDSFIGGMLTLLKAQNAATGAPSAFPQLTAEAVIAFNPEVVLLTDAVSAKQSAVTVAARPGWASVTAVQNRRVHPVEANLVNRPGPRVVDGIEAMARLLYPERFP